MFLLRYIILPPILALLLNLLLGRWWGRKTVATLACGSILVSFLFTLKNLHYLLLQTLPEQRVAIDSVYTWIAMGRVQIPVEFMFDPLSAVMCLVITGVGFLIHLYSVGYLWEDPGFRRYFIYLNLFVSFMLILVLSSSLVLLFVGWEGVGLCSYLLIGFWHTDMKNASAGKKAFVVNRVGDLGFLMGLMLILTYFGTFQIPELMEKVTAGQSTGGDLGIPPMVLTAICLFLFAGATGKSAQIPLYTWLPDAMAGPTPVSALIHAATMVTAGVYLIARLHFLYALSPVASGIVAVVGAATALYAAIIALAQTDIKKVLAYSTISQLGYMFLAVGVGAYTFGIFHLTTHAFFKALLFLGSGSVIHALGGEQDMRRMGGLRRQLPVTFGTMLIGTLAISGFPLLSGYFSKDGILLAAYLSSTPMLSGRALSAIGLVAALLTAFYMGRLLAMTFFGASRVDESRRHPVHESPWTMAIPLIILAAFSGGAGFAHHAFMHLLSPLYGHVPDAPDAAHHLVTALAVAAGLGGLALAFLFYVRTPSLPAKASSAAGPLYRLVAGKFFIDELYDALVVRPVHALGVVSHGFDKHIIDRAVNWIGGGIKGGGFVLSFIQTGNVGTYAVWFLIGVAILLGAMV